ncbi:ribonuclease P protein component [Flavobacteriaceae bacterium Ap0902]|nr:ribonuclease P protein component [Flavobacteriaceae bacterium Ap0902]
MRYTLKKKESLKSKNYFDAIFAHGSSAKEFPIRAIYIEFNQENFSNTRIPSFSQVAFSVPKKRFKRAVDRNRIKRQLREAYRLNKHLLATPHAVIFVYLAKDEFPTVKVTKAMISLLVRVNEK